MSTRDAASERRLRHIKTSCFCNFPLISGGVSQNTQEEDVRGLFPTSQVSIVHSIPITTHYCTKYCAILRRLPTMQERFLALWPKNLPPLSCTGSRRAPARSALDEGASPRINPIASTTTNRMHWLKTARTGTYKALTACGDNRYAETTSDFFFRARNETC